MQPILGDRENCLLMSSSCLLMWSNTMTVICCRCPETASMFLVDCDVVVGIKLRPDHLEEGNLTPMCSRYKTPKEKAVLQNTSARHPTEDDPDAQGSYTTDRASSGPDMDITFDG
ncbi:uncharacterized protein LOC120418202 [Culex pipiens pallens]|uniref:uncharacterized protein LOC120418202 n=1 Tax=Culex pipiens pallens TaxID=42434 RepID=UPI00195304D0|nr:uncharacterized protein LOC120418202 [Culex pipiens pallens]